MPIWTLAPLGGFVWWATGVVVPAIVGSGVVTRLDPIDLASIVASMVTAGALGGATVVLRRDRPVAGGGAVAAGILLAAVVVAAAGGTGAQDPRVTTGMQAIAIAATVAGLGCVVLAVHLPPVVRGTAVATPVVMGAVYVASLFPGSAFDVSRWVFAVGFGCALALTVRRAPLELMGWLPAGLVAWTAQAAVPALVVVGSMIRPGYGIDSRPGQLIEAFFDYLGAAWQTPEGHYPLSPWAVAIAIGLSVGGRTVWQRGYFAKDRSSPAGSSQA